MKTDCEKLREYIKIPRATYKIHKGISIARKTKEEIKWNKKNTQSKRRQKMKKKVKGQKGLIEDKHYDGRL